MTETGYIDLHAAEPVVAALAAVHLVRLRCSQATYAYLGGESQASRDTLDLLGTLYGDIARSAPTYNFVPLLKAAGWDAGNTRGLPNTRQTFCIKSQTDSDLVICDAAIAASTQDGCTSVSTADIPGDLVLKGTQILTPDGSDIDTLAFKHVALGGTFDRLHAGHRLLLAASAAVCTEHIYIGVTDAGLLANKQYREYIKSFDDRCRDVREFVHAVNPALEVTCMRLSDPAEPTRAETEPQIAALVVSEETIKGAKQINTGRVARGLPALVVVVVPVVGAMSQGDKLSSTRLRAADAARAGRPAG